MLDNLISGVVFLGVSDCGDAIYVERAARGAFDRLSRRSMSACHGEKKDPDMPHAPCRASHLFK